MTIVLTITEQPDHSVTVESNLHYEGAPKPPEEVQKLLQSSKAALVASLLMDHAHSILQPPKTP